MTRLMDINVFLGSFFICVNGQLLEEAKKLHADLMNGYIKHVFPTNNQSEPINVELIFFLISINSFREVDETISVTAGISMTWHDVSLTWDPASYGGMKTIYFPSSLIWTPQIYLLNTPGEIKIIGEDTDYLVTVTQDGFVTFTPGGVMEATCPVDVSKFLYDIQSCTIEFIAWSTSASVVQLLSKYDKVFFPYFTANSDWVLIENSTSVELIETYIYSYNVKISLKREPTYYAVVILIPTMVFCLLNPVVFLLPVESGERVSMAMTMLLSYAIFLTLVTNSIPATSNPMCFLLIMMIVIIAISGLILLFVIITLKCYYGETAKGKICCPRLVFPTKRIETPHSENIDPPGKEIVRTLDKIFLVLSHILIFVAIMSYIIVVNI